MWARCALPNLRPAGYPPMNDAAVKHANTIFNAATLVIKILGIGGKRWKRNVAKGARIGPWLQGDYEIVNKPAWLSKGACLYMVQASDAAIRYVGISRNGLKHRWRTSPAYDAETMIKVPKKQLFHSQCWKHIEAESNANPGITFEVRAISADVLVEVLERIGTPLSAFAILKDDGESVVAGVERWLCNNRSSELARWNVAMTAKQRNVVQAPTSLTSRR